MRIDYATLGGDPPETDVIVVGSGAAGISAADELARRGLSVLIVEAGNFRNDRRTSNDFYRAAEVHRHAPGELFRRRMVGGTTTVWGGRCIPYEQSDFDPLEAGDGARWPVTHAEVAPYIDRAVEWLQAGTAEFSAARAMPGRPAQIFASGDPSISLDEIERFSLPLNSWRDHGRSLTEGSSVHLLFNCTAVELVGNGDAVPSYDLLVASPDGRQRTIRSRVIILATGGIETPRLLLASRRGRPAGIGNEHGNVGRCFMTHVIADAGTLRIIDPSRVAQDYERADDGTYVRRLIKISAVQRREAGLMNMIARPAIPNVADPDHGSAILSLSFLVKRFILPEYRQRLVQRYSGSRIGVWPHLRNVARSAHTIPAFGLDWLRRRTLARRKLPALFLDGAASYPLQIIGEQAPLRRSRISLSDQSDRHGMPRVNIDWHYCEEDVRSLVESMRILARATEGNPVARVEFGDADMEKVSKLVPQGGHHIGTARMSEAMDQGVTDKWGKVWGTRNVFIAGSALFPRSGVANPTLMIVALALRTAEHIGRRLERRAA